jgi:hypothetical protein
MDDRLRMADISEDTKVPAASLIDASGQCAGDAIWLSAAMHPAWLR